MNFTEALIRLRDDLRNWVAVNLKRKVDKEAGKSLSSNDFTNEEKEKLKNIEEGAIKYVHPSYVAKEAGLYLVSIDETGHVSSAKKASKSDITALGIPAQDTMYTHPVYPTHKTGLYKVTVDNEGHVSAVQDVNKVDIVKLGIPEQMITYTLKKVGNLVVLQGSDGSESYVSEEDMLPKLGAPVIYLETDQLDAPTIYLEEIEEVLEQLDAPEIYLQEV